MTAEIDKRQPVSKGHRITMWFFAVLLTLLLVWLGRFVIADIDATGWPDKESIDAKHHDQALIDQRDAIKDQIEATARLLAEQQEHVEYLRQSTRESQNTMNQLIDIRQQTLERNIEISDQEKLAFARSQSLFLANQEQLQTLIAQVRESKQQTRQQQDSLKQVERQITESLRPAREEYERACRARGHRVVLYKFLFITPLLIVGAWLFVKYRSSSFAGMVYAFDAAVLWLLITIIHQHFPTRYYKYYVVGIAILIVLLILRYLARMVAHPSRKWLLRRYEEAYREGRCPVCHYPVHRGTLKYMLTGKKLLGHAGPVGVFEAPEAHQTNCPSCGTAVFEQCPTCNGARHAMLQYCTHCGASKDLFS